MSKKITTYTTTTCPHCINLKAFLKEKNITFENFDVGKDKKKADEMIEKSGQMAVPVIDIDGKIIIGFDKDEISKKLGIK